MPLLIALLAALAASAGVVIVTTPEPRIAQRLAWAQADLGQDLSCHSAPSCDDVAIKSLALTTVGAFNTVRPALTAVSSRGPLWVLASYGYWTASGDEAFLREQWPYLATALFAPATERIINDGALELAAADAILAMAREVGDSTTIARVGSVYAFADHRAQNESGVFAAALALINADRADAEISALADTVHSQFPLATGLLSLALYEQHREAEGFALLRGMALTEQSTSAMFVLPLIKGLLGWEADAPNGAIAFEPHLPLSWNSLTASGLVIGRDTVALTLHREQRMYSIQLDRRRSAPVLSVQLSPALPRGARIRSIKVNDVDVPVQIDENKYDMHPIIEFGLRREATVEIEYDVAPARRLPR
jgi:hypothetical protein